ncbi:hypothetical protein GCM10010434_086760 [Winogradskya humida]
MIGRPVLSVRGDQRLGLDRVAEGGAGAVRLHGVHVGGGQASAGERLPDDALLRGTVRRGQAVGGAVLVDRRAADDSEDLVAVALGVGQPLDEEYAGALTPARTVGTVGEGLAAAVPGQSALTAELDERAGCRHHRHTADKCQRALAPAQRLSRPVQGHQR